MSVIDTVRNRALDHLVELLYRMKTGHGSFYSYVNVYDGWHPDPVESPSVFLEVGTERYGERSSGLAEDAVVVKILPVVIQARMQLMVQPDMPPRTVAGRMIGDIERVVPGKHDLGGATINVELIDNAEQITPDGADVEVVVGVSVELQYQSRLTEPTLES